jgi:hypothetical protein
MHCVVAVTTPTGTYSFLHLCISLHDKNLVVNLVTESFMSLIAIPLFPLFVGYFSLISFEMAFSLVLSSRYYFEFSPSMGSPLITSLKSTLIGTILSIHNTPPCTLARSCFTHPFMHLPRPKCGVSNKFMIPVL